MFIRNILLNLSIGCDSKVILFTLFIASVISYATVYYISIQRPQYLLLPDGNIKSAMLEGEIEEQKPVRVLTEKLKSSIQNGRKDNRLVGEKEKVLEELSMEGNDLFTKRTEELLLHPPQAIAVLVMACNRVSVTRCLDQLLQYQPDPVHFPIIVSQDCNHAPTTDAILRYGDRLHLIQQPDQGDLKVPPRDIKFRGYFKIARHYGWALNRTFDFFKFDNAIVIEDDLDVSPDIFEYFLGTLPLLRADPTLWCVSAWNDNGKVDLVDTTGHEVVYRTDFFPGLGWMLTKDLWTELSVKWPRTFWDDWIRRPQQRRSRACLRPELSRTRTFGRTGVSQGLFYEEHLKFIHLNDRFVPFTKKNLTFLLKENYDAQFVRAVYESRVVTYGELKSGNIAHDGAVRIPYYTRDQFKRTAKALGLMDDFKSGVPRTGYRGIVTFFHNTRVYLAPHVDWRGYDPTWT